MIFIPGACATRSLQRPKPTMMAFRLCVQRYGRLPQELVVDHGPEFGSVYFEALLSHGARRSFKVPKERSNLQPSGVAQLRIPVGPASLGREAEQIPLLVDVIVVARILSRIGRDVEKL